MLIEVNIYSQVIPQNRFEFLYNIGLEVEKPVYYDRIVDVCQEYNLIPNPNGDWSTNVNKLNQIIQDLRGSSGWKCIYFSQPGTYRFGSTITLGKEDSNLVFKGLGSGQVILFFKIGNQAAHMFNIKGIYNQEVDVLGNIIRGTTSISTNGSSGLATGDWVDIYTNWSTIDPNDNSWTRIGQISKIENIQNNVITIKDKISITLDDTYNNKIIKFIPAQKIGFEDFTIQRDGDDRYSTDGGSSNFNFEYAVNCWIYGVESWGTRGWHVGIGKSSNIYIHGNFFHHSNSYTGGCGYGVTIFSRASNCQIENNIFNFLRHSILTQASANRNVLGYNYSYDRNWELGTADPIDGTGDISIHGTYSNSNLFEGNISEYIYADYTTEHKDNGPFNTIFRNIVLDGYSLNDIDLESIDYINLVGNKCDDVDFNASNYKLDIYGINSNNGLYVSHSEYAGNRSGLDPVVYCPDYSYYLTQKPIWMSATYSWPPIGPRISTSSSYLSQSNPAYSRHLAGGKKTLDGLSLRTKIILTQGSLPETNSYGGSYKINGNSITTWYPLYNEQVTIQALPPNSNSVFYKWSDGSIENPRTFNAKNSLQINAIFKLKNKSSSSNAYNKDGQRKFIRGYDGSFWKVYESLGQIWLEKDGTHTQLVNDISEGLEAKSPAIDYAITNSFSTDVFIVYQQKLNNGTFKLKLAKFNNDGQKIYSVDILSSTYAYSSFDATPVISVTRKDDIASGKSKFVFVWRQKAEGSYQDGLYFYAGVDNGSSVGWYYLSPEKLTNSDSQSSNPTIVAFKQYSGGYVYHHLAFQQGLTKIKYRALGDNWNGLQSGGIVQVGSLEEPSSGDGWYNNYEPSIAVVNIGTGSNYGNYIYDSPKLVWKSDNSVTHRAKSNSSTSGLWQTFYNYHAGDDITAAHINSAVEEPTYVIVWGELEGYYNRYIKSSSLGTQILTGTHGKNLQASNYLAFWEGVDINIFNNMSGTIAPYSFQTYNFSDGLNKITDIIISEGRFGTVIKNGAEFYFGFGDVNCNGSLISFKSFIDSIQISNTTQLNTILTTEAFEVNDNIPISYILFYGLKDSVIALQSLTEGEYISFRVELIDAVSNQIMGAFDEITQNNLNLTSYENIIYQINTNGIGNRTVFLRLAITENLGSEAYSLSKIYSDNNPLFKSKLNEVNWQGSLIIHEYDLDQNYPNPFNPNTIIKYQLPNKGFVTLKVYDILGNEIATLVNEEKSQGSYEVNFTASSLASGVYIYKLQTEDFC